MKGIFSNILIALLVVANIFIGIANYNAKKPKCICEGCNKVRVSGGHYCHDHEFTVNERTLCLEVISKN